MAPRRLPDAVHAQLGIPQIQRAHAHLGRQHRPDGAPARRVVLDHKQLQRHGGAARHLLDQHDAGRVGGVALVGVDLDDGSLVHLGPVVALVLAGVVGVYAVGHVGRDEERGAERLLKGGRHGILHVLVRGFRGRDGARDAGQPADDGGEHVGIGALGRGGADFLVVEAGHEADGRVRVEGLVLCRRDQALHAAERHAKVVEARGKDELVVEAAKARLVGVVEDQLKVDNLGGLDPGVLGDDIDEVGVMTLGHVLERLEVGAGRGRLGGVTVELGGHKPCNGQHLVLLVGIKVALAMQVDGEGRDSDEGAVDLDETGDNGIRVLFADEDATGDAQVAIEPRVPDATAIGLDADLQEAVGRLLADGLDAQAGRVGVGADHADWVSGLPLGTDGEGNDGRAVAGHIVLAAGLDGGEPAIPLLEILEAGIVEGSGRRGDGMVGWDRRSAVSMDVPWW